MFSYTELSILARALRHYEGTVRVLNQVTEADESQYDELLMINDLKDKLHYLYDCPSRD